MGESEPLFEAAKSDPAFNADNVNRYAAVLKRDPKADFISKVKPLRHVRVQFIITEDEAAALERKYVDDGPFKSIPQLVLAVLRGEKSVTIKATGY